MNPDPTAPSRAVSSGSILFAILAFKLYNQKSEKMTIVMNGGKRFNKNEYLHFQSKPLMNLKIFANVHSLMNDTKFD